MNSLRDTSKEARGKKKEEKEKPAGLDRRRRRRTFAKRARSTTIHGAAPLGNYCTSLLGNVELLSGRVEIPAVALIGKGKGGIAMTYKWIDGDPLGGAVCRLEQGEKRAEEEGGRG